jgi:hypothetical protein
MVDQKIQSNDSIVTSWNTSIPPLLLSPSFSSLSCGREGGRGEVGVRKIRKKELDLLVTFLSL